jgi:hypothetical protein
MNVISSTTGYFNMGLGGDDFMNIILSTTGYFNKRLGGDDVFVSTYVEPTLGSRRTKINR